MQTSPGSSRPSPPLPPHQAPHCCHHRTEQAGAGVRHRQAPPDHEENGSHGARDAAREGCCSTAPDRLRSTRMEALVSTTNGALLHGCNPYIPGEVGRGSVVMQRQRRRPAQPSARRSRHAAPSAEKGQWYCLAHGGQGQQQAEGGGRSVEWGTMLDAQGAACLCTPSIPNPGTCTPSRRRQGLSPEPRPACTIRRKGGWVPQTCGSMMGHTDKPCHCVRTASGAACAGTEQASSLAPPAATLLLLFVPSRQKASSCTCVQAGRTYLRVPEGRQALVSRQGEQQRGNGDNVWRGWQRYAGARCRRHSGWHHPVAPAQRMVRSGCVQYCEACF